MTEPSQRATEKPAASDLAPADMAPDFTLPRDGGAELRLSEL